jgi:hypothetical protein
VKVVALVVTLVLFGCKADLPELTDARGSFDAKCTGPNADLVLDTFPKTLDASAALGAPDNAKVMMEANNVVTVGFVGLGGVTEASGADIHVAADLTGAMATVKVAGSDEQFVFSGNIDGNTADVDIAVAIGVPIALYARITVVSGTVGLDAVQAIHDVCR